MGISEENIDLFESYLNGSLSEKGILDFDARLSYDTEFSENFEKYRNIESGIRYHYRSQMKEKFSEIDTQLDGRSRGKVKRMKWWLVSGAAAAAILVLGVIYLFQYSSPIGEVNKSLAVEYWPYEEGLPVKMSNKDKYDDAMNAFKLEQWGQSEELLHKIESDTANYFLGIVTYEQEDYQESLIHFNDVDVTSTYYNTAQYRTALVYILIGEVNNAKEILKTLIDKDSKYAIQAGEILSELQ